MGKRRKLGVAYKPGVVMGPGFLTNAAGAFLQIERPGPIRFVEACRGRPECFRDFAKGMVGRERRAGMTIVHKRFKFVEVGQAPVLVTDISFGVQLGDDLQRFVPVVGELGKAGLS